MRSTAKGRGTLEGEGHIGRGGAHWKGRDISGRGGAHWKGRGISGRGGAHWKGRGISGRGGAHWKGRGTLEGEGHIGRGGAHWKGRGTVEGEGHQWNEKIQDTKMYRTYKVISVSNQLHLFRIISTQNSADNSSYYSNKGPPNMFTCIITSLSHEYH